MDSSTPSTISQDGISILAPDHSIRRVPMKPGGLIIGRGAGADIALDDERVSSRHAQITFDGVNYQVTDLNSANGTYLDDFQLLPEVAQVWTPDKSLRVGGYYLRLEKRQALGDQTLRGKASVAGTMAQSTSSMGRVGARLETNEVTVAPGSAVVLPAIIINQSAVVDRLSVSVRGIPEDWLTMPTPRVELLPGAKQPTALTIQPPRASTSRAGPYPLTLRVISENAPDEFAEVIANLTVEAYHQTSSQLAPEKVRANKPARVILRNQGNAPEAFQLIWRDQADEVLFTPAQAQLTVPEGQEVPAPFTARPKHRRWIGGEKQHPYVVQVGSAASEAQTHTGQVVSHGLIPTWLPPLVAVVALFLCGILYALFVKPPVIEAMVVTPPNPPPNTPVVVSWKVSNCAGVELWDGANRLVQNLPCEGDYTFMQGFPTMPHLNLVASNLFAPVIGKATETAEVALVPPTLTPTPEPGAPVIKRWSVAPTKIAKGQSVTIEWDVSNAESAQVSPIGSVPLQGQVNDSPDRSTIYILNAVNKGKTTVSEPIQVIVIAPADTPNAAATATVAVQSPDMYISVKSAVEDYYALIQQSQYSIAWEMVKEFNQSQGNTFDAFVSGWQASGPAVIAQPFDYPDSGNTATITLVLNYPLKNVTHTVRYDLVRDPSRGNSRFGYWIFVHGTFVN